jgi:outer membrane protein OmpA-like peptidoglycan-associated protein
MRRNLNAMFAVLALVVAVPGLSGCAANAKTKGAVIGAAAGGVAGGLIGRNNGSTTKGAIIGAVVGGAAGAIIGHQMDQQAKELKQNIPGATVERVGEGIHVTFDSGLMFAFDSDVIQGAARSNLDALASSINRYDNSSLVVAGHTDDVGSETYNLGLSQRRAYSAACYLRARGVDREISTVGLGESEPVATNASDYGRQQHRRVDIAIYASPEARQEAIQLARG